MSYMKVACNARIPQNLTNLCCRTLNLAIFQVCNSNHSQLKHVARGAVWRLFSYDSTSFKLLPASILQVYRFLHCEKLVTSKGLCLQNCNYHTPVKHRLSTAPITRTRRRSHEYNLHGSKPRKARSLVTSSNTWTSIWKTAHSPSCSSEILYPSLIG